MGFKAPFIAAFVLIGTWAAISALTWVDPIILPSPVSVGRALLHEMQLSGMLSDWLHTVARLCAALSLSVVIGVPLGLLLGTQRKIYAYAEGPIHALRSVPAAALFPLFLIVIGVGEWSIVALASYNSVMVILINTVSGAFLANHLRLHQARTLGLSKLEIAFQILLWEALPHILTGIRVAAGYSLALIIAVEMFIGVSQSGLGRKIYDYQAAYRMPETYAAIIVTALTGAAMNALISILERRMLRWMV